MHRSTSLASFGILVSASLLGQPTDIPLTNWTVPPYTQGASGGVTTMTDIAGPRLFIPIQPCRVVDTRSLGVFTGAYGPPAMAANATRTFDINSAPHCPEIPAANAYSLNFTVTQTAGAPGDIRVWPTGNPPVQITSVLNWTVPNATVANATIMPAGANGSIDVFVAGTATHLLIDINGYFSDTLGNGENFFRLINSSTQWVAEIRNFSTACSGPCGVVADVSSGTALHGFTVDTQAFAYGVMGITAGASDAAGVRGDAPGLTAFPIGYSSVGVLGTGGATGVLGIAAAHGVIGDLINPAGTTVLARGILGFNGGATKYAVWGGTGNVGGTGVKSFVEPHPSDPSKVIRYVALEGPEAGTYFRGRGKFDRGVARIPVPEDFRIVTDEEGLTVQVTPIGPMATVSVVKFDLNEIVVQSSRNVEFFYSVQGVRRAFRNFSPIGEGREFLPQSADARIPEGLPEESRRRLIANGTYKPDGTVNMETARRLGWDRIWDGRQRPAPLPASE